MSEAESNVIPISGTADTSAPLDLRDSNHRAQWLDACAVPMVVVSEGGTFLWANQSAQSSLRTILAIADDQSLKETDFLPFLTDVSDPRTSGIMPAPDGDGIAITFASAPGKDPMDTIASLASELSDGSQSQAFMIDLMDGAIKQLQDAVIDITGQAAAAEQDAAHTTEAARTVQDSLHEALETLRSLGATSHRIENLAEDIDAVAKKTNLLALNAAIEAARVGEDGRGFAVIADQIRDLSDRAKSAVVEVRTLTKDTADRIANGVTVAGIVDTGLGEIVAAALSSFNGVASIVTAIEEQVGSTVSTYKAVDQVREIAEMNGDLADQILIATRD